MAHRHTFSEAHATQRTGGKNPSHDTADNATNAVHTEDIAGIIHPQQAFEHSNAPQARQTSYHADNQRAANPNVATRWRHADQTGNRARTRSLGFAEGVTMGHQLLVQLESIAITIVWSGVVAFIGYKLADLTVGLRVPEEQEREGLDVNSHGENAYNA